MLLRTTESRLCSFKQRPGVNVKPRRPFKNGLRTNCPQAVAVLVFGSRRKQLPQPPDRTVHGPAPPLDIKLRPEQVDKPLATMRSIRKVKRKPVNRRPAGPRSDQICSLLRVTRLAPSKLTVNTAAPSRANTKKCRFWLSALPA